MSFNQKGFAHILLLIILLIGVGIGVYLALNPTVFKPKASIGDKVVTDPTYKGLPWNDMELKDGRITIYGEPVYLKLAWLMIDFGPHVYPYSSCPTHDSVAPLNPEDPSGPKIKSVNPECMFSGKENPEEYLQYPKLLKQRGYNGIKIITKWYQFDTDGDGTADDQKAVDNLKELMQKTVDEGMYINLHVMSYPQGRGGVPNAFFDKNPDAQAHGFPLKADRYPDLSKAPRKWTDCHYKSPTGILRDTSFPGWADDPYCNDVTQAGVQNYAKMPAISNQAYKDTQRTFVKDFFKKIGPDLLASVIYFDVSDETSYQIGNPESQTGGWLDFSDNARKAFSEFIQKPENVEQARKEGCLSFYPTTGVVWNMQKPQLCNNMQEQLVNQNSLWNIYRARELAAYTNWEGESMRLALKEVLKDTLGEQYAQKAIVGADYFDMTDDDRNENKPTFATQVAQNMGNPIEYIKNLEGFNLIQSRAWFNRRDDPDNVNNKVRQYYIKDKNLPNTALMGIFDFWAADKGDITGKNTDGSDKFDTWFHFRRTKNTNLGLEFFHMRPLNNDYAALIDITPKDISEKKRGYPEAYGNSWTAYDSKFDPKPDFLLGSKRLLTKGGPAYDGSNTGDPSYPSLPYTPDNIIDFTPYPDRVDYDVKPLIKQIEVGKDDTGYFFKIKAMDNHLLGSYGVWVIKKGNDKNNQDNWIILKNPSGGYDFPATIYNFNQKNYLNLTGSKGGGGGPEVTLQSGQEYEFVINTSDYAGNHCDYRIGGPHPKFETWKDCAPGVVPYTAKIDQLSLQQQGSVDDSQNSSTSSSTRTATANEKVDYTIIPSNLQANQQFKIEMRNIRGDSGYVAVFIDGKSYWITGEPYGYSYTVNGLAAGSHTIQLIAHCDYSKSDPNGGSGPDCSKNDAVFNPQIITVK